MCDYCVIALLVGCGQLCMRVFALCVIIGPLFVSWMRNVSSVSIVYNVCCLQVCIVVPEYGLW